MIDQLCVPLHDYRISTIHSLVSSDDFIAVDNKHASQKKSNSKCNSHLKCSQGWLLLLQ